jgi:hypothetical protein
MLRSESSSNGEARFVFENDMQKGNEASEGVRYWNRAGKASIITGEKNRWVTSVLE